MKKIGMITLAIASALVFTELLANPVNVQKIQKTGEGKNQLPLEVIKITEKSCNKCHALPAKGLSISLINFSKWNDLSPKKQASKAKSICNMVSKDKMPPKNFLEKNPDAALTKDDIKTLCDWATSLEVNKK